jgi:O-methyltransferase
VSVLTSNLRQTAATTIKRFCVEREFILSRYAGGHRTEWMRSVSRIQKERTLLLGHGEACQIISAIQATSRIPGDLAELGVAYGASAKLILQYSKDRHLHLFDTFSGLPDPTDKDSAKFKAADFRSDVNSVREYLGPEAAGRTSFHVGLFPETAAPATNRRFSFVHLDVDLYQSTLDGLEFFYPRMSPGGIIISHDFMSADGVNRAFLEYFANKTVPVIELTGYQCMVVKLEDTPLESATTPV